MSLKERLGLLGAVLAAIAGLCAGWAMVGEPAKLSGVITLFFAGFGTGASIAAVVARRRLERLGRHGGAPGPGGPAEAADARSEPGAQRG